MSITMRLSLSYSFKQQRPCSPLSLIIASRFSSSSDTTVNHHQRQDDESYNVKVSVWWDFENCNVPACVNIFTLANTISAAVRNKGIKGPLTITAFGDVSRLSRDNQERLSSTGIKFAHVPTGGESSADRSLLVDLIYWVSQNPPPAHIFLISGDTDFSSILHRLRMNNYNILLASPESTTTVLCNAASIVWHWPALVKGETLSGKLFNQPPDGPYGSWYGHYEMPLEEPFSVIKQPWRACTETLSNSSKLYPVPQQVVKHIKRILSLYPNGICVSSLREELLKNLSLDRDYYGYKRFSAFLLSMPHILKLDHVNVGVFMAHAINSKAPEPFKVSPKMAWEVGVSSILKDDKIFINRAVKKMSTSCLSASLLMEESWRKMQHKQNPPLKGEITKFDTDRKKIVNLNTDRPQETNVQGQLLVINNDVGNHDERISVKPLDTSKNEVLKACKKLVKEILKDHPKGYNMSLFRKDFLEKYGYPLDIHKLGYKKLSSLLKIIPGVRVESNCIVPSSHPLADPPGPYPESEISGSLKRDDCLDSAW